MSPEPRKPRKASQEPRKSPPCCRRSCTNRSAPSTISQTQRVVHCLTSPPPLYSGGGSGEYYTMPPQRPPCSCTSCSCTIISSSCPCRSASLIPDPRTGLQIQHSWRTVNTLLQNIAPKHNNFCSIKYEKSRIRETMNLSTDADHRTNIFFGGGW